jgi:hypothetical protein
MPRNKMTGGYAHPNEIKLYDVPDFELAKPIIEKDPFFQIHIPMLGDRACIKEIKFKVGFRQRFQTSRYLYRLYLCLKLSNALLEDTNGTIGQKVSEVGFDPFNTDYGFAPIENHNRQSA